MGRSDERLESALKALRAFNEVLDIENPTSIIRDAAIQRFEFSFETAWKAAKQVLFEQEGLDIGSPKGVIRSCREVGLLNDTEAMRALEMADDRNLTVHTYNEELAIIIFSRLKTYRDLIQTWMRNLDK